MDVSLIRDLVAIAGVIIALTYYILNIRNQRETRQTQLFMGLYETYRSTEFRRTLLRLHTQEWTDFEDFYGKYGQDANPDSWIEWEGVASFFNGIGVLVQRKLINISLVNDLLSISVFRCWSFMGPILVEWRKYIEKRYGQNYSQESFQGFDYLFNEIVRYRKQRNLTVPESF